MRSLVLLALVLNLALAQADATGRLSRLLPDLTRFGDAPQILGSQPNFVVLGGMYSRSTQIWDSELTKKLLELEGHLAICSNQDRLITTKRTRLFLQDAASSNQTELPNLAEHPFACALSPDNKSLFLSHQTGLLIYGLSDGRIEKLVDLPQFSLNKHYFNGVVSLGFAQTSQTLATGSIGGGIWLWQGPTYKDRAKLAAPPRDSRNRMFREGHQIAHAGRVRRLQFSSDGNYLVSLGGDGSLRVWDVVNRSLVSEVEGGIFSFALDSSNQTLYVGAGYSIQALSFPHLTVLGTFLGHADWVGGLALNEPAGKLYSTTHNAETLKVWDIATRTEIASYGKAWASFSPDRKWLAYTQKDGLVRILDAKTGKFHRILMGLLPFPRQIYTFVQSPVFSPSGTRIAASSCFMYRMIVEAYTGGGRTLVWDIDSGKIEQAIDKPLSQIVFKGEQVSTLDSTEFGYHEACQK